MRVTQLVLLLTFFNQIALAQSKVGVFPKVEKSNHFLKINNKQFQDDFDTIENDSTSVNWYKSQEDYFKSYFNKIGVINTYNNLLTINNYEDANLFQGTNNYFRVMYSISGQSIYIYNKIESEPRKLIDNDEIVLNKGKFALIRGLSQSKDSRYLAYAYSINAREILRIKVFDINKNKHLTDTLKNISTQNIHWFNNGFFYSRINLIKGANDSIVRGFEGIYYHELNTLQKEDSLIFRNQNKNNEIEDFLVINNENYLIIKQKNLKQKVTNVFYKKLQIIDSQITPLLMNFSENIEFVDGVDSTIYFLSSKGKYKNNLFSIEPNNLSKWNIVITDLKDEIIDKVMISNGCIISSFIKGPKTYIRIFSYLNSSIFELELPIGFSISKFYYTKMNSNSFLFNLESVTTPKLTYKFDFKSNTYEPILLTKVNYNHKLLTIISKNAIATDGKKIPLLIAKLKDTKLTNAPILLESYGGYGLKHGNNFKADVVDFINNGGVYVYSYIRGGGELGEDWHIQGSGINKSQCFNDFISTAEFLIDSGFTTPQKLAIRGGSHGGLVVGVALTQRPELFKLAICNAAPLDIVKFLHQKKSLFQYNEFGNINEPKELDSLAKYNPYYNIKPNINYPVTLVYSSEKDSRVPLSNSAKFVAALQNNKSQQNPILLLVEKDAGHFGAEKSYSSVIQELSKQLRIIYHELDM